MKAQKEGGLGPDGCREGEGTAVLRENNLEGSAKVCVSARRSRRERDPGLSQDQQEPAGTGSAETLT